MGKGEKCERKKKQKRKKASEKTLSNVMQRNEEKVETAQS